MAQFKPYPKYKDSGVEWLGKVPEHWEIKPIKSLYNRVKKTGFEQEILLSVYREYGVIIKSSRDDNHNRASDDLSPYQLVNISDLVINKMKAWQGSLAISEYKGIVSPAYYIYTPIKINILNNKFIHNQIRSKYFIQSYKNFSKGIRVGQWDLENDLFVRINLYIPSLTEQTQIADYLDQETAKIDTLIAKQEKLIELLEEQRKSIISHAVTKGLDPNTLMKDSGVEWLGKVPEHWEVLKLRQLTKLQSGDFLSIDKINEFGKYSVYGGNNIRGYTDNYNIMGHYILIGRQGSLCGNINYTLGKIWATEHAIVVYPKKIVNILFLGELLRTMNLNQYSLASAQAGLSVERILNIYTLYAPINEQEKIADYLDQETAKIDTLIAKQKKLIKKLKEYKASVISHAVTGKIDVRELAA